MTATELADELGVHEGDVRLLVPEMIDPAADLPNEIAAEVRMILNPHGERSAYAAGLYWPDDTTGSDRPQTH